ncbi:hypothetical protein [Streptomyces sp. NPDC001930]|uniref:hypothetical protein n=1 Tax=Streptomyces sp. NPDC001930 TaxID=3364625 RepID=UPI0036869F0D
MMPPYAAAPARRATPGAVPASLPWAARVMTTPPVTTLPVTTLPVTTTLTTTPPATTRTEAG